MCLHHILNTLVAQFFQCLQVDIRIMSYDVHHHRLLYRQFEQQTTNSVTQRSQTSFQHIGQRVGKIVTVALRVSVSDIVPDRFFDVLVLC